MQIQDGPTAKLVGYQMDHGHHGAVAELPDGGIVESPRNSGAEVKAKVMAAPKHAAPEGVEGAQTA